MTKPSRIFPLLAVAIALIVATTSVRAEDKPSPMQPEALYGSDLLFSIWRNDSRIGTHETKFSRDGGELIVDTKVNMQVKVLFITAYQMDHKIREIWRDGSLQQLDVWTDDDGEISQYVAERQDNKVVVKGPDGPYEAPPTLMTTSHWNHWILDRDVVFNTLTGQLNRITLAKHGPATVKAGDSDRNAIRYAYTGELDTDIWFDDLGRWVKLKFKAPDGSDIEYICESCGKSGT